MASSDDELRKESKQPSSGEWSIEAVHSLLEIYGQKFAMGRGFLRNKDWEDVVAVVNSQCGGGRFQKTMKQCRDKIDSLKKRYKLEKRRAIETALPCTSWPYFLHMDEIMSSRQYAKDLGSSPLSTPEKKEGNLGLGCRKRSRERDEMCEAIDVLADAIDRFSDLYARMEMAKMEVLSNLNVELVKLVRGKKRKYCPHATDLE